MFGDVWVWPATKVIFQFNNLGVEYWLEPIVSVFQYQFKILYLYSFRIMTVDYDGWLHKAAMGRSSAPNERPHT